MHRGRLLPEMGAKHFAVRWPDAGSGVVRLACICAALSVFLLWGTPSRADWGAAGGPPLCDIASPLVDEGAVAPRGGDGEGCGGAVCDPSGASAVGEPLAPLADGGRVEELPCEAWQWAVALTSLTPRVAPAFGHVPPSDSSLPVARGLRADSVKSLHALRRLRFPEPVAGIEVTSLRARLLQPCPGFGRGVYRPPVRRCPHGALV